MKNSLIIIAVLLTSCVTHRDLMIRVNKPPEIPINESIRTVLIINSNPVLKLADQTDEKLVKSAKDSVFVSIHRALSQYYHVIYKRYGKEFIDKDVARELCRTYNADLLIDLRKFCIIPQFTTYISGTQQTINEYDEVEYCTYYSKDCYSEIKSKWVLYDNKTSKYYNFKTSYYRDEVIINNKDILLLSTFCGFIIEKITGPTYDFEPRHLYYCDDDYEMFRSQLNISFGKWETAAAIWKECINNPIRKVRYAASHNLAVYYERKGNLKEASRYYEQEKKNRLICLK